MNSRIKIYSLAVLWILVGTLGRLIPHPSNMTPLTALSLFAGAKLSQVTGLVTLLAILLISDASIASMQHIPMFGNWAWFSYSGFITIYWLGLRLQTSATFQRLLGFTFTASVCYWLWTNLGVWLMGSLYPLTLTGLIACYTAAIPFLRNALGGDLLWVGILFYSFHAWVRPLDAENPEKLAKQS